MIPRYSRPEMTAIWSEQNKMAAWLQVELAVCEAWTELGVIPAADMEPIRRARLDHDKMNDLLGSTHHDVLAFVRTVAESVGEAGRFIHLGLTSSDVLDTALAVQIGPGDRPARRRPRSAWQVPPLSSPCATSTR